MSNKPERVEFIDAMRGLIMFLVVSHHVSNLCFHVFASKHSIDDYIWEWLMPMFFFISGFVLFRRDTVWDVSFLKSFFKKKIHLLLLVPLLFFIIYVHVFDNDIIESLFSDSKAGYWFTFVLFGYYTIYAIVRFFIKSITGDIILLLIGLCFLLSCWPPITNYIPISPSVLSLFCFLKWQYFIFFIIGTLIKKFEVRFMILLNGKWLITICILYYFLVNVFFDDIPIPSIIFYPLLSLTGIIIVFYFFYRKQNLFSKKTVLGRTLQFIGRRTLDIYWIHFFLIPYNLSIVTVFKVYPMPVIETCSAIVIAFLITAGTLLISSIIRLSPFLSHFLFGVKEYTPNY